MRLRSFGIATALVLTTVVSLAVPAIAATWTDNNCNLNWHTRDYWKRSQAESYARTAVGDGYEWGGGCWNSNGVDDTPNAPDSGGEGPDCSGYVFKAWALDNEAGADVLTPRYREMLYKDHGPYTASSYHHGNDPKFNNKSKGSLQLMDALASTSHVGMYIGTGTASGTVKIIEALNDSAGVGIWDRDYHNLTSYTASTRAGWTAECYPQTCN